MEAKDTVMHETIIDTFNRYNESILSEDDWDLWGLLEAQAKISFKAGIKEVVDWVDEDLEYSSAWQEKKKEWGIKDGN